MKDLKYDDFFDDPLDDSGSDGELFGNNGDYEAESTRIVQLVADFIKSCDAGVESTVYKTVNDYLLMSVEMLANIYFSNPASHGLPEPKQHREYYIAKLMDDALKTHPDAIIFVCKKLELLFLWQKDREAIEYFENMREIYPNSSALYVAMAESVYEYGIEYYDAEALAVKSSVLNHNVDATTLLVKIALDQNKPSKAFRIFNEDLQNGVVFPEDILRMKLFADYYIDFLPMCFINDMFFSFLAVPFNKDNFLFSGSYISSLGAFLQMLCDKYPLEIIFWIALGGVEKFTKNNKKAIECLENARSIDNTVSVISGLANAYYCDGNFAKAIEYLESLNDLLPQEDRDMPDCPNANILISSCYRNMGQINKAIKYFSKVDDNDLNWYMFVEELTELYVGYGRTASVANKLKSFFCDSSFFHFPDYQHHRLLESLLKSGEALHFKKVCYAYSFMFRNDNEIPDNEKQVSYLLWLAKACVEIGCSGDFLPFDAVDNVPLVPCYESDFVQASNYFNAALYLLDDKPVEAEMCLRRSIKISPYNLVEWFVDLFKDKEHYIKQYSNVYGLITDTFLIFN